MRAWLLVLLYFVMKSLLVIIFTLVSIICSDTYGDILQPTRQDNKIIPSYNTFKKLSTETKRIMKQLLNATDVALYNTQSHNNLHNIVDKATIISHTGNISSTKNDVVNETDSYYTNRRHYNTIDDEIGIKDPAFQKLLDKYRGLVHKFDAPKALQQKHPWNPTNSRLTTEFRYTRQGNNHRVTRPSFIKERSPKWGNVVRYGDAIDIGADQSMFVGGTSTAARTKPKLPGHQDAPAPALTTGEPPKVGVPTTTSIRFTSRSVTRTWKRTTPQRVSFEENCDYIAYYCLKAYETGKVCGRTMYNKYMTFKNYCLMDFVNCMERYEVWQIMHMGECFELKILDEYLHYPYVDDYFLDQYYVIEQ